MRETEKWAKQAVDMVVRNMLATKSKGPQSNPQNLHKQPGVEEWVEGVGWSWEDHQSSLANLVELRSATFPIQ